MDPLDNTITKKTLGKYPDKYEINKSKSRDDKQKDLMAFNKSFEENLKKQKDLSRINEQEKLAKLNEQGPVIPIYNKPIGVLIIEFKDELYEMLDDILKGDIYLTTFTKDDRLFHIGLLFLLITIVGIIYDNIFNFDSQKD